VVLKGSLREFILADIFNLIAQQKITGKLLLSTGEDEGVVAFKEGVIVGAVKGEERLTAKLFNLLTGVYHFSHDEMEGLFTSFEKNMSGLLSEVLRLNLLPRDILEPFAASVIEDICCSFFSWSKGTYYFSSLPYVDDVATSLASITVENITMEAMRRVDEWNRMEKLIRDDTVFVPTTRHDQESVQDIDPLTQRNEFVFSKVDGTSTVAMLFRMTCLTEYKVYESLNDLLSANRITPLSTRISQAVVAALEKKELEGRRVVRPLTTVAATLITLVVILAIIFIGKIFVQGVMLSDLEMKKRIATIELPLAETIQKVAIASLQYHALHGASTANLNDLTQASLLVPSDLRYLIEMKTIKELPINRKNTILYHGQKK
jgi:hypothetical protein